MKLHLLTASLLASLALTACQQDTAAETAMTEPTPAATDTMVPADTMAPPTPWPTRPRPPAVTSSTVRSPRPTTPPWSLPCRQPVWSTR